jgi:hypothetical protein
MTGFQSLCLVALVEADHALSATMLAAHVGDRTGLGPASPAAVGRTIRHLERKGLVEAAPYHVEAPAWRATLAGVRAAEAIT